MQGFGCTGVRWSKTSSVGISGIQKLKGCRVFTNRSKTSVTPASVRTSPFATRGTTATYVRVLGAGFRVQGSGFRVQGSGFRVQGSGFRVQGSGFRVHGVGSTV